LLHAIQTWTTMMALADAQRAMGAGSGDPRALMDLLGMAAEPSLHAGLREVPGATYKRIDGDGLHYDVNGESRVLEVDSVVTCAGQESDRALYDELVEVGVTPVLIGGAHTAAELDAVNAIDSATRAACAL
jgi:hypothetical protein